MGANVSWDTRMARESRAIELRQQGWSHRKIAAELGCHCSTVHYMLKRVDTHALRRLEEEIDAEKRAQIVELRGLFAAAIEGWERSREDTEAQTVTSGRAKTNRQGDVVELPDQVVVQRRKQCGNPQFLLAALAAKAALRDLLGLNAPKSVEVTAGGEPVVLLRGVDLERL